MDLSDDKLKELLEFEIDTMTDHRFRLVFSSHIRPLVEEVLRYRQLYGPLNRPKAIVEQEKGGE